MDTPVRCSSLFCPLKVSIQMGEKAEGEEATGDPIPNSLNSIPFGSSRPRSNFDVAVFAHPLLASKKAFALPFPALVGLRKKGCWVEKNSDSQVYR